MTQPEQNKTKPEEKTTKPDDKVTKPEEKVTPATTNPNSDNKDQKPIDSAINKSNEANK